MIHAIDLIVLASLEGFVIGIPEAAGLLIFGVAMALFAIVLRRSLRKEESADNTRDVRKQV